MNFSDEFCTALKMALEANEYEIRSYSGRSMYGRTCLAVTVEDMSALFKLGAAVYEEMTVTCQKEADMLFEIQTHWDAMGRQYVVYWPEIPHDAEPEEDEE